VSAQSDSEVKAPFWQTLDLAEMSPQQWESLCDGCARCCLNKLEYEDTGEIDWTEIACHLLEDETCRCEDYDSRHVLVPDCIALTVDSVQTIRWLPPTCAYRLVAEGRDLYWWHPLVSGAADTVHLAGVSVRGRTLSETDVPVSLYDNHVVTWPNENPFDAAKNA